MHDRITYFSSALSVMKPELWLVATILIVSLWNLFSPRTKGLTPIFSLLGLVGASLSLFEQFDMASKTVFGGLFTFDKMTVIFGLLSCLVGFIIVLMTMGFEQKLAPNRGEFYALLLTAILSVVILAGATDLILLFVGLETLTICCVLLSGFSKFDKKSNEASLKYLLSTAATTATFLFGLSFLYGLTGATSYYDIHDAFAELALSPSLMVVFLIVLLISVIGFKLSLVPFHMWTPDVYEGAPTPVTAFLSVGSKLGGFVVAIRLLTFLMERAYLDWAIIIGVLSILSMVAGNIIALMQTSFKRMLAYSSIAHVGYMLIGLVSNNMEGLTAMLFYIIVYAFMNLGAFTGALIFSNETGSDNIDDFAGLVRKRPWLVAGMSFCLLNLAGLPIPPAGFLAKFFIFMSGMRLDPAHATMGHWLIAVALITSVPAIYYYCRVIIKMIVREPSEKVALLGSRRASLPDSQMGPMWALALCVAGIIAGSFAVNSIMEASSRAATSMVREPAIGTLPSGTYQ